MPKPLIPDNEFLRLFETLGPAKLGHRSGRAIRSVLQRRANLEKRLGRKIVSPVPGGGAMIRGGVAKLKISAPWRIQETVKDGHVIIASDCHYWPGEPSLMHRALLYFIREMRPKLFIANGDVVDLCSVSRHPPIGWENMPTVQEEIEAAQDRLNEIAKAAGRARKIWTLGNHDSRFETRLATVAPEFAKIVGVHLKDHFPLWDCAWSVFINDDIVVKHRFKSGIHAPWNNTMWAGRTIITGHLHSAKVMPLTDYDGTRYGVDTGCIADTSHQAFVGYTEDNPLNWRSSFCLLTLKGGRHLMPELITKWDDDHVQWRGEVIKI